VLFDLASGYICSSPASDRSCADDRNEQRRSESSRCSNPLFEIHQHRAKAVSETGTEGSGCQHFRICLLLYADLGKQIGCQRRSWQRKNRWPGGSNLAKLRSKAIQPPSPTAGNSPKLINQYQVWWSTWPNVLTNYCWLSSVFGSLRQDNSKSAKMSHCPPFR